MSDPIRSGDSADAAQRPSSTSSDPEVGSTQTLSPRPVSNTPATVSLAERFRAAQAAHEGDPYPSLEQRLDRLDRLDGMVATHGAELADALVEDYGQRSMLQTLASEAVTVRTQLGFTRKRVKKWMAPRRVHPGLGIKSVGGSASLLPQPLGVVGVMSPWNFPLALTMAPATSALAAGNRVMCKVSELTPSTADAMARAAEAWFDPTELTVVVGGKEIAEQFSALPFGHLFFTGSTAVGKLVMRAASENLTPVTLELGGKSPFILGNDADMRAAARTLITSKTFNAGQYCVAPDRVYVPTHDVDRFLLSCREVCAEQADDIGVTAIVNEVHHARLRSLRDNAVANGATQFCLDGQIDPDLASRRDFPPIALLDVDPSMDVWHEEVFGPLFTIHRYADIDELVDELRAGPEPLAAYWFGSTDSSFERFLHETPAGGVVVNDIMLQVGIERLPFGGVGQSGMGTYHGQAGFDTFSHVKPVVRVRSPLTPRTLRLPAPEMAEKLIRRTLDRGAKKAAELRRP